LRELPRHGDVQQVWSGRQSAGCGELPDLPQQFTGACRLRELPSVSPAVGGRTRGGIAMNAMKLMGRTGKVSGQDKLIRDTLRIGAAVDNDFQIMVAGVSRHHAKIVKEGDAYWLEDAGSTNGTFLNGQRVTRERLRHLDIITLGRDVDLISVETGQTPSGIV